MCHMSRLTPTQQRVFDRMPQAYQQLLVDHIEEAPPGAARARQMFDAWAARLEGVDNARRAAQITEEVITEAWETVDVTKSERRRKITASTPIPRVL